jgi:transcriptional regulator with GAF, ATPase, and Fis domain
VVPELSGSEFFGHERGAFTGASNSRVGALANADGGTLLLDELGELPLRLQAELLRAVQERSFKKVGGNAWERSQYRLICATHRDLERERAAGSFRTDFYFRIANVVCRLPSLEERREDILPLAHHFMRLQRPGWEPRLDCAVAQVIARRAYPGNVRELCLTERYRLAS